MKHIIFILVVSVFTQIVNAQDSKQQKQYYQEAKTQLEEMLNGKEKPNFEKAIYIIENVWYENKVDKQIFEHTIQKNIDAIQYIFNNSYNEKDITQKPSLLISQEEIIQQYKKALTNYAIYNYITNTTIYTDSNHIFYHKPYKYSSTDPMASNNWENTQVINLNNAKQGNCFALASLFKIFADRLNSDANLCIAPSHIYIRHKDDKGTKYNVELGNKNFPGTGMISAVTYTTNQAIQNGIAQRELNTTQAVALSLVYLAKGYQHKFNNTSDEFILQCAETALQYDHKNLNAQLLKAEYLENKLTAQHKTIAQLQTQTDFKEYQNLIAQLYNEGYREMPLEMKNTILKIYNKEKINPTTKPIESVSLSFGLFDERHKSKPSERINNTVFNTKTKKISSFTKDQILYNNYNFDPVTFAWNIDPLASKLPFSSPYVFCLNNPILMFDKDGAYPFTIHVRSFHPNNSFGSLNGLYGNGFSGDSRGFSLSTANDVTSRVNHQFTFDVDKGTTTYDKKKDTWSNSSHDDEGNTKTAKPNGKVSAMSKSGNFATFNTSYAANNPLATGSPDIDVKANFAVYEDTKNGLLTVGMNAFGDDFPNTEAFITDASGNSVFLGVDVREQGNDDAPFILSGGPNTNTMKALFSISLDKKGNFTGVQAGGKKYTLEEWNSKHTSVDAKPSDKK